MIAQPYIDCLDFAHNGRELLGTATLAKMPGMQDILVEDILLEAEADSSSARGGVASRGEVNYVVRGLPDIDGKPMLEISVEGSCRLRCQRCLNGFDYAIKLSTRLLLVRAHELDEFSEDGSDEVDSIVAEKRLDVLRLIEEEILLSLPFAPKHPLGECQSAAGGYNQPEQHPFAALEGLTACSDIKHK